MGSICERPEFDETVFYLCSQVNIKCVFSGNVLFYAENIFYLHKFNCESKAVIAALLYVMMAELIMSLHLRTLQQVCVCLTHSREVSHTHIYTHTHTHTPGWLTQMLLLNYSTALNGNLHKGSAGRAETSHCTHHIEIGAFYCADGDVAFFKI